MIRPPRSLPVAVMAAQFWTGSTGAGIAAGLRRAGWLVHEIDIRHYEPPLGLSRPMRAINRLSKKDAVAAYRRRIVADCEMLRPDLFLTIKGVAIDPKTLGALSGLGVRTAIYYPDVNFEFANFDKATIPLYDDFATTKSFQIDFLREARSGRGVHYVPHGYCSTVHRPLYAEIGSDDYLCDVGYAGNFSPYKAEQLGRLLELAPDLRLSVTGPNWQRMKGWPSVHATLDRSERRNLAYSDFVQRSAIGLAFHYGPTQNGWADLVSTRTFEIPACGGFMLHIENEEIHEFFDAGTEIDTFACVEELASKIAFYLTHDSVRREMAARAHRRAVPAYSYEVRAGEMLQALGLPISQG